MTSEQYKESGSSLDMDLLTISYYHGLVASWTEKNSEKLKHNLFENFQAKWPEWKEKYSRV
jgi:hypothetical protein